MPRRPVDDNKRMSLRIGPETKTTLLRAAALTQTDLTEFVIKHALDAAREIIDKTERIELLGERQLAAVEAAGGAPSTYRQTAVCRP